MASYTRQSTFSDGDLITAELFNDEYNQLLAAFENTTGHKHDGTVGEGPVISIIGDAGLATPLNKILIDTTNDHIEFWVDVSGTSTQQLYITDGAILPVTDNDIDLGSNTLQFKDLYINGTANIDTVDIDAGTVDGVTIGGSSAGAITGTTITATNFVIGSASINETELEILDGATLTTTELNYVDGVTSSIQTQIDTKAPLASPSLTGIPTAPTASANTNTTQIATTAYVQSELTDLIDGAPGTLDTLNELAAAINDDANYNSTLTTALATKLPLAGGTMTGDVTYSDNVKAQFGTSQDLQIYHDGSNSYIKDAGIGNLQIQATGSTFIKSSDGTKISAQFAPDSYTRLYYNNAIKLQTTSTGIDVTGVITTDGLTTSADINFGDNDKAVFGAGSDLQLYHDGSNSYIQDSGSGNLRILVGDLQVRNYGTNENIITSTANAEVALYYNASEKLATTNTGINVTGTVVSDGLILDANTGLYSTDATLSNYSSSNGVYLNGNIGGWLRLGADRTGQQRWDLFGNNGGGYARLLTDNKNRLNVANNGDISFYEDTGTTAKFFWDASAESLGIGTASPARNLHVHASNFTDLHLTNDTTGATASDGTSFTAINSDIYLTNREAGNMVFQTSGTERARIDASGNVMLGKSSVDAGATQGFEFRADLNDLLYLARAGNAITLNRLSSDGDIALFRKDGTTVGSIGFTGGLYIASAGCGLRLHNTGTKMFPTNSSGAAADGTVDLGASSARFKDLHLSGIANFGSLSDGTITITGFVDEDNMATNSATLVPTQQSVKAYVDSQISSAGGNGISFEDNEKAQFGDGNDLQIYHNGSNSYIDDAGQGALNIRSNGLYLEKYTGEVMITAIADSAVTLYHNNASKLATTSTGIDVTGTVTSDGLTVAGSNANLILGTTGNDITFTRNADNYISATGGTSSNITINPQNRFVVNTGGSERARIDSSGRLGIGTTSPSNKLHVVGDVRFTGQLKMFDNQLIKMGDGEDFAIYHDTTVGNVIKSNTSDMDIVIQGNDGGSTITALTLDMSAGGQLKAAPLGVSTPTYAFSNDSNTGMTRPTGDTLQFVTAGQERVRINSSGYVGINMSNPSTPLDVAGIIKITESSNTAFYGGNYVRVFSDQSYGFRNSGGTTKAQISMNGNSYFNGGNFGIGTASPDAPLTVHNSSDPEIRFGYSSTQDHKIAWDSSKVFIHADPENANGSSAIGFSVDGTERARIDSSGLFLVGKTSGDFGTQGSSLVAGGHFVKDGNTALYLNRLSSDGSILAFYKDSSLVGSIGVDSTDNLYIAGGSGSTKGLYFNDAGVLPATTGGGVINNAVDLGQSGYRFKDLYLSGSVTTGDGTAASPAIKVGDNDTGLFQPADNVLGFSAWGTERMRLTSTGLGIGTTSPDYPLSVTGAARFRVDSSSTTFGNHAASIRIQNKNTTDNNYAGITFDGSANTAGAIQFQYTDQSGSYGDIAFESRSASGYSEKMRITSSGSVGIGTGSPDDKLHIHASSGDGIIKITGDGSETNGGRIKGFNGGLGIETTDGAGNYPERMRINSSGNVGIGDSAPQDYLEINGSGKGLGGLTISNSSASHAALSFARSSTATARIKTSEPDALHTSALHFQTSDASGGSPNLVTAMYIDENQRVGIGTTSPASALHIGNAGHILLERGGELRSKDTGGAVKTIVRVNSSNELQYGWSSAGAVTFMGGGSYTERMRIHTDGNIGIGTSSPAERLTVLGNQNITGKLAVGASAAHGSFDFYNQNTAYFNGAVTIDDNLFVTSGSVGINTTSPSTALEVNNASAGATVATFEGTYSGSGDVKLASFERSGGAVAAAMEYNDATTDMEFGTTTSHNFSLKTADTRRLTITSAGDANFTGAITTAKNDNTFTVQSTNAGQASVDIKNTEGHFRFITDAGTLKVYDQTDSSERARIDSNGQLLIGKTASDNTTVGTRINGAGFISSVVDGDNALLLNRLNSDGGIVLFRRDGVTKAQIGILSASSGNDAYFSSGSSSTTGVGLRFIDVTTTNAILPCRGDGTTSDNLIDLGSTANRFDDIYATNGTIQTSDRNDKQDIQALTAAETRVATACKGLLRKFRWQDAVTEKGDEARYHFGIISQDLQDAFTAEGLDAGDYGMFISETWEDSNGVEQTRLGVRYSELLAFIIAAI